MRSSAVLLTMSQYSEGRGHSLILWEAYLLLGDVFEIRNATLILAPSVFIIGLGHNANI
jgi:hypothetical protein